jgi:peptidoglycan hydrolase-like protein with peptidoglycan-binding domain
MSGNDVLTWQMRMISRGWNLGTGGSTGKGDDGIFSEPCHEVLMRFQEQKGFKVDGVLGPMSWNAAWELPIT